MSKKRRTYTQEFKLEAVKLVTEEGYSVSEAADRLGIHGNVLGKWKKSLEVDGEDCFPGKGKSSGIDEELRRLRTENKRLRMERDILKKATVFFAKESR